MKRTFIFTAFLMLSIFVNGNSLLDSLYNAANEAYSSGKYEEAIDLYSQIQEEGFESAELYFNMGNAAFRSNKLGFSILFYEKALKLNPTYEQAQKNLDYVSIYKEDKLDKVPELFLKTWIKDLFRLFSLKFWSVAAVMMFFLLLVGALVYIFSFSLAVKKTGFFSALIALLLFIISFSAAYNQNAGLKNPQSGVIVAPSVVVKSSPSLSGTDLFILHEGSRISIDERVGDWTEVKISDGREGWILNETLRKI